MWYAVSSNFKNNPRTNCKIPGDAGYVTGDEAGCLNSDSRGTITVRNKSGTVINDGSNPDAFTPSGVIAVIIAPGRTLQRQGAGSVQDRSCTVGVDCDSSRKCTTSPPTLTPKCNPVNYLDTLSGTEDNASFTDSSATDGFINGIIYDASNNVIVNDRIITITYQDLMPVLEKRVVREAYNCLVGYSASAGSNGRYPWAASVSASGSGDYSSVQNERFGRLPDSFAATILGLVSAGDAILAPVVSSVCSLTPGLCMSSSWPSSSSTPACYITTGSWWNNWKELVFYGVADAYKPAATVQVLPPTVTVAAPTACDGTAGNYDCLAVSPPTSTTADNKRFTVMVAGKRLSGISGGQPRTTTVNKQSAANYLEDENGNNTGTSNIYGQQTSTSTFNDVLLYLQ